MRLLAPLLLAPAALSAAAWSPAWPSSGGPFNSGTSLLHPGPGAVAANISRLQSPPASPPGTAALVGGTPTLPTLYYTSVPYSSPPSNGSLVTAITLGSPSPPNPKNFTIALSPVPVNSTQIVLAQPPPPPSTATDTLVAFTTTEDSWTLSAFDGATGAPLWSATEKPGDPGAVLAPTPDGSSVLLLTPGGGGASSDGAHLRVYDAATGALVKSLAPGSLSFGGPACWALVASADGTTAWASSETAVTRWALDAADPSAAVLWSSPHGLPPTAPPQAAAALFEIQEGGAAVAVAGAGSLAALRASDGAVLWSWKTPASDQIVALMSAPSAGSIVALHNGGFWSTDYSTSIDVTSGVTLSTLTRSNCFSEGGSGAVQADGSVAIYLVSICWGPPEEDEEGGARTGGAGSGVSSGNGYPAYLITDRVQVEGALSRLGTTCVSGGDYAGSLSTLLPIGPGTWAFWPFTGFSLLAMS
jgi:hypothetical protein